MFKIVRKTDLAKSEQQIRELREDRRRLTSKLFFSVPYEQHSAVLTARNRVIRAQGDHVAQLKAHNERIYRANAGLIRERETLTANLLASSKNNMGLIREVEGLKRALREAKAASLKVVPEIGYECTYRHTCVFKKEAL